MPATYAHYRFGTAVLEGLDPKTRGVISRHPELYYMGLHGPDLLFYYRPLGKNHVNATGYGMHKHTGLEFFQGTFARLCRRPDGEAYLAYAYGFLCHFVLDSACHGYIGKAITETGVSHTELEGELDRCLLLRDGFDPVKKHLTDHIHPSRDSAEIICRFFPGILPQEVYQAQRSYVRYNNLLVAPSTLHRKLIDEVLRLSGHYEDMHGLVINRQANPRCAAATLRLRELYNGAIPTAITLIQTYRDTISGKQPWDDHYYYTFDGTYHKEAHS